jgi:hypothetical protein
LQAFLHDWSATLVSLHALISFDAFRHTYEQAETYSNLILTRHPWLNLLTLNFEYHNADQHRASWPRYRLPALHRSLFGEATPDYGNFAEGPGGADNFVGAYGATFLTVV